MSQFSQELLKLESSKTEYIRRMSDCIVNWDSDSLLLFFHVLFIFLSSIFHMLFTLKICVRVFSGSIEAKILELSRTCCY